MSGADASGRERPLVTLAFSSLRLGGIQRGMLSLAAGILARGVAVDLLVLDPQGELRDAVPPGASLVPVGATRTWRAALPLAGYLRRRRPAAVLASQTHLNVAMLVARALARVPTRVVASEHVALDAVLAQAGGWKERLFPLGARLMYPRADGMVFVSRDTAARFLRATGLPDTRASVIYNPVVGPDHDRLAAEPVDHPWFDGSGPPVIVAAGRLVVQKDHATLVRAFARLRSSVEARLVVLGEGAERHRLEALVEALGLRTVVDLPGFVANPLAYMARASLFVLSSRWEGFGNAIVEAMACGTPVVCTDCPSGPSEILAGGAFGRLVPVGDVPALEEAMRQALAEPADRAGLRARAREFTVERSVARHLEVLLG